MKVDNIPTVTTGRPPDKGKNLIAVLPNTLTSAKITAEWEHKLKQIERGELDGVAFMDNIAAFTKAIVLDDTRSGFVNFKMEFGKRKA